MKWPLKQLPFPTFLDLVKARLQEMDIFQHQGDLDLDIQIQRRQAVMHSLWTCESTELVWTAWVNQKEVMNWEVVSMHKQQPSHEVHWDVCSSPSPAQHPAHHPPQRVCTPWVTIPINSRWHPWGLQQLHRSCSWYISALGRRGTEARITHKGREAHSDVKASMNLSVWLSASPWTVAHQAPLSMGFSRQEYWSGLPFPPPGDLPHPGIKLASPEVPALAGKFFTTEPPGNPLRSISKL